MSTVPVALRRSVADLQDLGAQFALVGGLAISARAEPRFTRDVDLAIAVDADAAAEALVYELRQRGYGLMTLIEHLDAGRIGTARMTTPEAPGVMVDLLFASCGIEPEIVTGSSPAEIDSGLRIPVASVGHLAAMKLLARSEVRLQDTIDLFALAEVMRPEDRLVAQNAVDLICDRGFARERNLQALVAAYLGGTLLELGYDG